MKRQIKDPLSPIVTNNWKSPTHSKQIREQLLIEQKNHCAYTELYIHKKPNKDGTDAHDVEHFNPLLKNKPDDGYDNWFAVNHTVNRKKSDKWGDFLPILYPAAYDLEQRVTYEKSTGLYMARPEDQEAKNLINLIGLNDFDLVERRCNYIDQRTTEMKGLNKTPQVFFEDLQKIKNPEPLQIYFITAIETVFGIKIDLADKKVVVKP